MSLSRRTLAKFCGSNAPDLSWKAGFDVIRLRSASCGNVEPELSRLLVERRLAEQPLQHLPVEADGARLLVGERLAQPALVLLQRPLILVAKFLRGDLRAADGGDGRGGEAAQHVADAPDDEADDDQPHDDRHDRLADEPLSRVAHRFEHSLPAPICLGPIEARLLAPADALHRLPRGDNKRQHKSRST